MQSTAHKNEWPLDRMSLQCEVTKKQKDEITYVECIISLFSFFEHTRNILIQDNLLESGLFMFCPGLLQGMVST